MTNRLVAIYIYKHNSFKVVFSRMILLSWWFWCHIRHRPSYMYKKQVVVSSPLRKVICCLLNCYSSAALIRWRFLDDDYMKEANRCHKMTRVATPSDTTKKSLISVVGTLMYLWKVLLVILSLLPIISAAWCLWYATTYLIPGWFCKCIINGSVLPAFSMLLYF